MPRSSYMSGAGALRSCRPGQMSEVVIRKGPYAGTTQLRCKGVGAYRSKGNIVCAPGASRPNKWGQPYCSRYQLQETGRQSKTYRDPATGKRKKVSRAVGSIFEALPAVAEAMEATQGARGGPPMAKRPLSDQEIWGNFPFGSDDDYGTNTPPPGAKRQRGNGYMVGGRASDYCRPCYQEAANSNPWIQHLREIKARFPNREWSKQEFMDYAKESYRKVPKRDAQFKRQVRGYMGPPGWIG